MTASEKPSTKGQAWFCTTGLPSDIVVEVEDMTFHLHKFPLMSKSRKIHDLITEQETNHSSAARIQPAGTETQSVPEEIEEDDEIAEEHCHITFADFPGGSETFEIAAKFCYGVKIDLSSSNVVSLRCAGEFLEMTEEYSEDNLISKTEKFFSQFVLKSIKDSIRALKSCERLMPLAETLGITQMCIDSVVASASSSDPALIGWPLSDPGANDATTRGSDSKQILWNAIGTGGKRKGVSRGVTRGDPWLEDLARLSFPVFKQLILALKNTDTRPEVIECCLLYYAKKHIPGVSRSSRKSLTSSSTAVSEAQQKGLLETIILNLPLKSRSKSSAATRFLFGLLRTANILNASEVCRDTLEKKIGSQLEEATLDDLLIPNYSHLNETLYDVDCVERMLGHFLEGLEERNDAATIDGRSPTLTFVGKQIDGYLSEIASDANLKPERFYNFAHSLPEQARLFDDGLYRAIDIYLKAHPRTSEAERERICGLLDCQKLTLEACTHAAQNERLPLRAVIQVLFFEQLQLRHAVAGSFMSAEAAIDGGRPSGGGMEEEAREKEGSGTWSVAERENQVLRLDMDSMRTRVHQLERECSTMRKVIAKIDNKAGPQGGRGWRASLGKKFGCKFKTQVCDSREQAVVDTRKGRPHQHQPPHAHAHNE
ncbi:BTB/POZ domain-containing protein At5g66560-like isoform X2 [Neltuma alba]|uniref:BTB/POZ domain-containing protein At5g66560-like isoform X2 n=1 Tax=Neltuma alba TaxID=207710 RepID=UPI0010A50CBA|nr:BTB/POZ domain-containing protein At5g66560-like isoform X2 [Prosopis alba]